ncbi:MAG: efflux RND transporter permease subunit [Saprospirales bacterium]|nr:efflux RND transporter permease subunit [Saprospirales bacterium]
MLNRIIRYSLENRMLVMVFAAMLTLGGLFVASRMEVDVFPDLTAPTVVVMTEAQGMAPEEVERLVTFRIETAVNGATNVRRVRSSSTTGFSVVWIEFEWGTDIYIARQVVSEKLISVKEQLPEGVGSPTLGPQSSLLGEVMLISLTSDTVNAMDLRTMADWVMRPRLLAIGGVAQVVVIGGEVKQFQIQVDPQRLQFYHISLGEVMEAARKSNQNANGGIINQYGNEYIIRGIGRTSNIRDIGKTVIKAIDNIPVKLEDVARVTFGAAPQIGMAAEKGKPAVILTVTKQPNTNTLELVEKLDVAIAEVQATLPGSVHVSTDIFRQSTFIEAAVDNVKKSLLEGSVFVIIVLFVFLMNFRTTVISLLAIPISLLVAILSLKLLGFTINTMSLGGMAIAIGALVDDAIIDVDNVYKRLKQNILLPIGSRRNPLTVVFEASKEIRASIVNATLIIIVAFIPLFFLSGIEGRMLIPLGVAFIVSLFASLIVAITLTPVLCSYLLTNEKMLARQSDESRLVRFLNGIYGNWLSGALRYPKVVAAVAAGLFIGSLFVMTNLGRSFLPEFNEGSLVITTTTLPGISLEESDKLGKAAEEALLRIPEIRTTARKTGRAELDEHALGVNTTEIEAPFELADRSKEAFFDEIRHQLSGIPGMNFIIGQPIGHRIDHMLSGTRANIAIKLFGTDLTRMYTLANEVKTQIQDIEGLIDLNVEQQVDIPQIQIKPRREMLAKYCISIEEFTNFVDVALAGEQVAEVYEENRAFALVVRFNDENRKTIEAIRNALMDTHNGSGKVPLHFVADVVSSSGPNTINRENVQRKLVISANVEGGDLRGVVNEIQDLVSQHITLPPGYRIEYGGQFESEAAASRVLLITSLFSILIIFLLLYQEFKHFSTAIIILINLPLALIGGIFTVWATSGIISIPAIIGFITLLGIATRNGILLIARYNLLKKQHKPLHEAILEGSVERLSPILMTALTAALALVPLALQGDHPGNEIQSPMAKVILGGLLSSTLLNIFVIPAVYFLINRAENEK